MRYRKHTIKKPFYLQMRHILIFEPHCARMGPMSDAASIALDKPAHTDWSKATLSVNETTKHSMTLLQACRCLANKCEYPPKAMH